MIINAKNIKNYIGKEVYLTDDTGRYLGLFTLLGWQAKEKDLVALVDKLDDVVIQGKIQNLVYWG
jgi:hypothetical protein